MSRCAAAAIALTIVGSLAATRARADLILTAGTPSQTITFDSTLANVNNGAFTGAGFAPSPSAGQLDSDSWAVTGNGMSAAGDVAFGGTNTSAEAARGASAGGVTDGGIYGFDVDNTAGVNRALGLQPAGNNFTPGSITLRVLNSTGVTQSLWGVAYDVFVLNNEDRSNSVVFAWSTNGTSFTTISGLTVTSPAAASGSPAWAATSQATNIAATVANGGNLYLRWTFADVGGSGSRDEFALDNITVAVPEVSPFVFGGAICTLAGLWSLRQRRRRDEARI
jgi:hypothetical protein